MGVWIETLQYFVFIDVYLVTPFVGVWIETQQLKASTLQWASHPSWVWIETLRSLIEKIGYLVSKLSSNPVL